MDYRLALMTGIDIPIPECQLTLHQPTLKEIAFLGETEFFTGLQTITLNKTMFIKDKADLSKVNNFQIFMMVMGDKQTQDKKQATKSVFSLFFPDYQFVITPRSLSFSKDGNSITIDESNFEILQDVIRLVTCAKNSAMDQQAFNPANEAAKKIAEKLMKGREKVARLNGQNNISIFAQYISILTIGLYSMSLKDLIGLTIYQLYDLIERYHLYTNWDIDIRSRLAGGKNDKQPENWMKNIHAD